MPTQYTTTTTDPTMGLRITEVVIDELNTHPNGTRHDDIVDALAQTEVVDEGPEEIPPQRPVSIFMLQQNTQSAALRELRASQPPEILHTNFQQTVVYAFDGQRAEIRSLLNSVRQYKAAREAYWALSSDKDRHHLTDLLGRLFPGRAVRDMQDENADHRNYVAYRDLESYLSNYRADKATFLLRKARFGPMQATYNQQIAMIRQRPHKNITINCGEIMETLKTWDNVWGVAIKPNEDYLKIRIGLCGITMSESASTTRYDYAADILLAPFLFTLQINQNGSFICRSTDENVMGLSREGNPGGTYYDMHPHQLSDTPCFGTFGQTLNDMANNGHIIPLISGIIAFYSQYNSADSAGVYANYYHPSRIRCFPNGLTYRRHLINKLQRLSVHHNTVNVAKLRDATRAYQDWHHDERTNPAPSRVRATICNHCEENDVSDASNYFVVDGGDTRVCEPCWDEYYCHECERHNEDCVCGDDDY